MEARQRAGSSRFWLVGGGDYWATLTIKNESAQEFLDAIHWSDAPFSVHYGISKDFQREWLSLALDQFKKMVLAYALGQMK